MGHLIPVLLICFLALPLHAPQAFSPQWQQEGRDARHTGRVSYSGSGNKGQILWVFNSDNDPAHPDPRCMEGVAAIGYGGAVYVSSNGGTGPNSPGKVFCLSPLDGSRVWVYPNGVDETMIGDVEVCPAIATVNGQYRVVFGSADHRLRCLDAESGSLIWRSKDLGDDCKDSFVIAPSGRLFVVTGAQSGPNVFAFDQVDSGLDVEPLATAAVSGGAAAPAAVFQNGTFETLAIATVTGKVYNLRGSDLRSATGWLDPRDLQIGIASHPVIGDDGTIFVPTFGALANYVYAFKQDGTDKWTELPLPRNGQPQYRRVATCTVPGEPPGTLHAFGRVEGSPCLAPNDSALYFGTYPCPTSYWDENGQQAPNGTLAGKVVMLRVTLGVATASAEVIRSEDATGNFDPIPLVATQTGVSAGGTRLIFALESPGRVYFTTLAGSLISSVWPKSIDPVDRTGIAMSKTGVIYVGSVTSKVYAIRGYYSEASE